MTSKHDIYMNFFSVPEMDGLPEFLFRGKKSVPLC